MIFLGREATCTLRSCEMTDPACLDRHRWCPDNPSQVPEVVVGIRFRQSGVAAVLLADQFFGCCCLNHFANSDRISTNLVPTMVGFMESVHNLQFADRSTREWWERRLSCILYAEAAVRRDWVGLMVVVDIVVPGVAYAPTERLPATPLAIRSVPKRVFGGDGVVSSCAICMEEFEEGEELMELPCSHSFHEDCIERWLKTNGVCPLCRYRVHG